MSQTIEAQAFALSKQVRCMVCQGQTIDASDTQLAADMRSFITTQLENGMAESAILNQLQSTYGTSILVDVPVQTNTIWLWVIPFLCIILLLGLILRCKLKRKKC